MGYLLATQIRLFTFFCLFFGSNSSLTLNPLRSISCPEHDEATNTCYEMYQSTVSCVNVTFGTCNHLTSVHDSSSEESDGSKHSINDRYCVKVAVGQCTRVSCNQKCCTGWRQDVLGRCLLSDESNEFFCQNGGQRDRDKCICKPGLTGRYCETAFCNEGCELNGGMCIYDGLNSSCKCPPAKTGSSCELVKCAENCANGGTCLYDGNQAICVCPNGFYGSTCSEVNDIPQCLAPNKTFCRGLLCAAECQTSSHCSQGKLCCSDGCCLKCLDPRPIGCMSNGVLHKPRDFVIKDKCIVCSCQDNGQLGFCHTMICPELRCRNGNQTIAGQCCPSCKDSLPSLNNHHQSSYKPPSFRPSCVNGMQRTLVTDVDSVVARSSGLNIAAYDYRGKKLNVSYNPDEIPYCRCSTPTMNSVIVTVSATDKLNNTAYCNVIVHVKDETYPLFRTCPSNIYALDDEVIWWKEPIAYDAVGIRSLVSNYNQGSKFEVGSYMVLYTATDLANNSAYCSFMVYIQSKDTDSNTWPSSLTSRVTTSTNTVGIIVGSVSSFVFVVALAIIAVSIYRCRKASARIKRQTATALPSISNSLYENTESFEADDNLKYVVLPPYSPASAPPLYDEIFNENY